MKEENKGTESTTDLLAKAREAEADQKLEDAAALYEQLIKAKSPDEFPYDRLMIIYRKLKRYKDELRVVTRGIKLFEDHYSKTAKGSKLQREKLTTLSNAFMKNAGLKDKKGNLLFVPEPIARWKKRRAVVEKKTPPLSPLKGGIRQKRSA